MKHVFFYREKELLTAYSIVERTCLDDTKEEEKKEEAMH